MTFRPFENISFENGQLVSTPRPDHITTGAWLMVTNSDIRFTNNPSRTFAEGSKHSSHPRRVILTERPPAHPRMVKARARSSSDKTRHLGHIHTPHTHEADYPQCCCVFDPKRPVCHVTKARVIVKYDACVASNYCCTEPSESELWRVL